MFDYIKHKDFQMARNRILKVKKNKWELIFASKMRQMRQNGSLYHKYRLST